MNIGDTEQELMTALLTIYADSEASSISNWVMEHYTGKSKMQRSLDKSAKLTDHIIATVAVAKDQLLQHRPVHYVLGESWFMGLRYYVDENVLVPRPETEELVAYAIPDQPPAYISVLDIGTGSGCISIAIKKELPGADITAIDVSHGALQVAVKNAATHGADIHFVHLDFLDESKWDTLKLYDLIISNPPYIPLAEKRGMDKNVTDWEPGMALFVPDNQPLLFYKKIAAFGKVHLAKAGKIFVETHQDYAVATQQMFEVNGYQTELLKDVYGNNRILTAQEKTV